MRKQFSSSKPPYFDDRGRYYIKYGEPFVRHEDKGSMESVKFFMMFRKEYKLVVSSYRRLFPPFIEDYAVRAHEIWSYTHIDPDFIVYFVKSGKIFQEIENLEMVILSSGGKREFSWFWSDFIKKRRRVSPILEQAAHNIEEFEEAIHIMAAGAPLPATLKRVEDGFRMGRPHQHLLQQEFIHTNEEQAVRRSQPVAAYEPVNAFNTIRFHKDIAQFRGSNHTTRLEITFLSSFEDNWAKGDSLDLSDTLNIAFTSLLRDTVFNPISRDKITIKFPLAVSEDLPNAVGKLTLTPPSQQGDLTVQVEDINNDKIGFIRDKINVRDFSGDDLMISDIQLLTRVTDENQQEFFPVFEKQSLTVSPYPYTKIRKSLPVYCYFEIYNLKTADILGEYEITLTISYDKNQDSAIKKLGKWATRSQDTDLSITHTQQVISDTSVELIAFDLGNLINGAYHLKITVSEMGDEKTITSVQKNITIVD